MIAIIFKDITVELASRDECFLTDIAHLILELNYSGRSVDKVNLFSRESMPGVWDADKPLVLLGVTGEFMLSVSMQFDENDRQLVGSMELNEIDFYDLVGTQYEIPLLSHESYPEIIFRTKISTAEILRGNSQEAISRMIQSRSRESDTIEEMLSDGRDAFHDFNTHGTLATLDQAVSKFEAVAEVIPKDGPRYLGILNGLGALFFRRFERLGRIVDINASIEKFEKAIALTRDNDAEKPDCLNNLGCSLIKRFESLGNIADINAAIDRQQAAVALTPDGDPSKPGRLSNLGHSFRTRFKQLGNVSDINTAITHEQAAVDLTPNTTPNKSSFLINLGASLQARFERFGNVADIEGSIAHNQAAVNLTPDGHPEKPNWLNNLGSSYHIRFERFGKVADIDSAIIHKQASVSLTPDDHPNKPRHLNNLGNSLQSRYERLGKVADIDGAIIHHQAAVNLTPDGHPDKPNRLNNLGNSLETRYERFRDISDIDKAIVHEQAAIKLSPDGHPAKPRHLNSLGIALRTRFERFGKVADIDGSIAHLQTAIDLTPNGHPNKPGRLSNIGTSLKARFDQFKKVADINGAIIHYRAAVNLTLDGHPQKASYLNNIGSAFRVRFLHLRDDEDARAAILYLSASAKSSTGSPTIRFRAAQQWITVASLTRDESLLPAYECALALMPLVAWLGLSIADRHEQLVQMGGIARRAAAAAISLEQYDKALEWLEQGRSIVWNQILQLRTPVDELRLVNSDLADRLLHISQLLDRGVGHNRATASLEEEEQRYRALTSEWESIIEQIRSLQGFEDFLKPPGVSRLIDVCQDGPVVVFNIARERCDALTLVPGFDEAIHIPLPGITSERVTELRDKFKDMLYSSGMRMRGERAAKREGDDDEIEDCRPILAELWEALVKPVLDSLAFSPHPDVLPHIWWCTTGPLAFLPIHAAGIYGDHPASSHVSDYVISSYTPTISSLRQSIDPVTNSQFKLLSVIQPSAPGVPSIPNTKKELECIKSHLGDREHTILNGQEGTKERVIKEIKDSNWVHLACHGSQRQDEPTKSGLILEDGHLTLEEIIKLNLPNAELAFLSACQTTTGEETLSDEAVHIAGGMLLAGYRGVVATMWSIRDDLAPEVANEFYKHIMADGGRPDSRKAAEALHYSVQQLRKKGGIPLTSWIPFVHLGV